MRHSLAADDLIIHPDLRRGLGRLGSDVGVQGGSMKLIHLLVLIALVSAACPNVAAEVPKDVAATEATISGSRIKSKNSFLDDQTSFISSLDGVEMKHAKKQWQREIPLPLGAHQITASFSQGSYKASASLTFNAIAGHAYALQAATNTKWHGGDYYCDFSILDVTESKQASETVRAAINYRKIIFVPIAR